MEMKIGIKRDTGAVGGLAKISVKMNREKVASLKNNEEKEFEVSGPAQISANQWYMGSKTVEAKPGDKLEIKINPLMIPCFILFVLFLVSFSLRIGIVTVIAFIGILAVFVFCIKNYLIVKNISAKE
ncbi:hypothetical protein [Listeria valentina]|uniref:hypothetical protein n=1 Tax=Listeria valentina TaxID=2705293 RepID=UPI00143205C8|nr:hypothetical protein [Listeria valentina]